MPLWGKNDSVYSTGTVAINYTTRVATFSGGATLPAAASIVNKVLHIGAFGSAIIESRTDNTKLVIKESHGLNGNAISGQSYNIYEAPVWTVNDSNYSGDEIFGADVTETTVAGNANSVYQPTHAGWVGITSYVDSKGNTRVKTEVLVAGSSIIGDASDDQQLADSA